MCLYRNDSTEKIIYGTLKDFVDEEKIYNNIEMTVSYQYNGSIQTQTTKSDKNGEYEIVVPKSVDISDLKIQIDGYDTETELKADFYQSSAVVETTLSASKPTISTITGAVLLYNESTYDITPIADHTVSILQDNKIFGTAVTNSKGMYEVEIESVGEVIVKFDEDKQETVYVNGDEHIVNACYIINDGNNDGDDNNGGGNDGEDGNGDKDTDEELPGLPGILYDYWDPSGREDRFYTIYYCSSITVVGPSSRGRYDVDIISHKIVSKGSAYEEERVKYPEPYGGITYWSDYPDGHKGDKSGAHRFIVGGSYFPYGTRSGSAPLPEEVIEKLMAGEMIFFFEDENAPDGQKFQYTVIEHEYD